MEKIKNLLFLLLLLAGLSNCKPKAEEKVTTTVSSAGLSKGDITNITNREISSWEFAKTRQLDKLKELLADDYQAFFGKIIMNKTEVLQSYQRSRINNYRLSNIRVKKLADNVAVIYYEALQDATDPEGDRWVPQIGASTTYVKRANTWYAIFYHETAITR
jgi:Calcium/calmodulin dependent protein kinase II association domain